MDFLSRCETIKKSYKHSPELYRASKFWEDRNELNEKELRDLDYKNFKQHVNRNYFQFMPPGVRDKYFLYSLYLTPIKKWLKISFTSRMRNCPLPFGRRFFYKFYVCAMYELVKRNGLLDLFDKVKEPEEGNPVKIWYDGRMLSQDILTTALEFSSIDEAAQISRKDSLVVAEVGAGSGRVGYFFHSVLKNKKLKYCIFDIPPALCVSETYLTRALPHLKVFKFREFKHFSEIEKEFNEAQICFFLPHQMELLPSKIFDLFIAISNMPEMDLGRIRNYFNQINKLTKGYFYNKQFFEHFNKYDNFTMRYIDYPVFPSWDIVLWRTTPDKYDFFEAVYRVS